MNVIVIAPKGKMGEMIVQEVFKNKDLQLVGAVGRTKSDYIGEDIGLVCKLGKLLNIRVEDDLESIIELCDVIIDFSMVAVSLEVLEKAIKYNKALVIGTTGFNDKQLKLIEEAKTKIPLIYAANTSYLMFVLKKMLRLACSEFNKSVDYEIIEMHDAKKLDAPSGTSKELGEIICECLDTSLDKAMCNGRFGKDGRGQHLENTIGYHSVRAGNISSTHTIIMGAEGERIELTHRSYDFRTFARGACKCALYLNNKKPGYYSVDDVLENNQ